jgi:hypothetical protein
LLSDISKIERSVLASDGSGFFSLGISRSVTFSFLDTSELNGSSTLLLTAEVWGDVPELVETDSLISDVGCSIGVLNILCDSCRTNRADGSKLFSLISVGYPRVCRYNNFGC